MKPRVIANEEALTCDFDDPTPRSTVITMRWEKTAVSLEIGVDTPAIVQRSLRNHLRARAQFEWQPWTEAANYLVINNVDAAEALKDSERSIEIEDRFENEMTRSRALTVLGRNDQAAAARERALSLGTQSQVHDFGRGLQAAGQQEEALELFRANIRKDPDSWVAHNETARVAVASGDFATAVREMKLAATACPETFRAQHLDLVRRLQNNEDINK